METLQRGGVHTHHIGLVEQTTGRVICDLDTDARSDLVLVRKFPVIRPDRAVVLRTPVYDYHDYVLAETKVIALEHVVRLGVPSGSSIIDRYNALIERGDQRSASMLLDYYNLQSGKPAPWTRLAAPACDWATKFEDQDRHLSLQEAVHISGLPVQIMVNAVDLIQLCALKVESIFHAAGLQLWDLKWELAYDGSGIVLVDTLDQDSMRVTYQTRHENVSCYVHFNKQAIRDYYRVLEPQWYAALNTAKKASAVSADAESFMDIYRRGVESNEYPDIPKLDDEFAAIQGAKYEFLYDAACGRASASDAEALAAQELKYYQKHGAIDAVLELNHAKRD